MLSSWLLTYLSLIVLEMVSWTCRALLKMSQSEGRKSWIKDRVSLNPLSTPRLSIGMLLTSGVQSWILDLLC